jgi:hypothetical protein
VELSKREYASTTIMPTKKDIFGNWTKCQMCGDYIDLSTSEHDLTNIPFRCHKRFFILLAKLKCLTF